MLPDFESLYYARVRELEGELRRGRDKKRVRDVFRFWDVGGLRSSFARNFAAAAYSHLIFQATPTSPLPLPASRTS